MRRAWPQTVALTVILAIGVASLISMSGAYRDLSRSYNHTYEQLHYADVTFTVAQAPEAAAESVAEVPGVAAATGRLIVDSGFVLPTGEIIRCRLIGVVGGSQPQVNSLYIREGQYLPADEDDVAVVEGHFAAYYHLVPGDTVTPIINGSQVPFRVVGVAASPEYLIVSPSRQDIVPSASSFAVLFVPLRRLQTLGGASGQINDIAVTVDAGADQAAVIAAIEPGLDQYQLLATVLRRDQPSTAALQLDLDGFRELADAMPGLILLAAAMAVYVMLGRLVRAQQPQIGLMKALGYSSRAVMTHYIGLALTIGVLGSLLGVLLGLPLAGAITAAYAGELGIPLVSTQVYPWLLAEAVVLSLLFSVIGGLGPARASARLAPATAMRVDPSVALAEGRASFIERLVGLPLWARLALRNAFRARRRSLTTAVGIIFAFTLVLMSWGFIDSMGYLLRRQFQEIEKGNVFVAFGQVEPPGTLAAVRSLDGVTRSRTLPTVARLAHGGR